MRRKSKKELSSQSKQELILQRYRGPTNPSMPKDEAKFEVLPLTVLSGAALSIQRANNNELHFMQLLGNDFEIPEFNSFNTKITRERGQSIQPATQVTYLPLFNMNPADPDTILTTINIVRSESEKAGQEYAVYTNDQQLYRITTQVTWCKPDEWRNLYPILGGMHTLMSFVGCTGNLMANTGLSDILKSAFGGVEKILLGKNFPQNTSALQICAEEVLRLILDNDTVTDFDSMMVIPLSK